MDVDVQSGRYVVAVSGGVDSVALLYMLSQRPDVHLTVAHYDHGIRPDSAEDRRLVQKLARKYGLPFVYHEGKLGAQASEATARQARYNFLHQVRQASGARAVITAHHQDDLLETIILNLLRGTNRRGLSPLRNADAIERPLLDIPKIELLRFAEREGLEWREDSTNADDRYLRNYIRHRIMTRFAESDREALLAIAERAHHLNREIDLQVANYLHLQPARGTLDRQAFVTLPHELAREIMAEWLLKNTGAELSRKLLERLVTAAKTGRTGTKVNVNNGYWLEIGRTTLALK